MGRIGRGFGVEGPRLRTASQSGQEEREVEET
jgi:hypothetical protein